MRQSAIRKITAIFFFLFLLLTVVEATRIGAHMIRASFDHSYGTLFANTFAVISFGILVVLRDAKVTRIALFVVTALVGYTMIWLNRVDHVTGDLMVVAAAIIAHRLGLLTKRPKLILAVMFGIPVLLRVNRFVAIDNPDSIQYLNFIVVPLAMAAFMYWAFEEDLIRLRREKDLYQRELNSIVPFAEFGRNVTGVVHDFNNDAALFSSLTSITRQSIGSPIDETLVDAMHRYTQRLTGRIQMILTATTAGGNGADEDQFFDLKETIEASVYVFRAHTELRKLVKVRCDSCPKGIQVRGDRSLLVAILENVIRNSCDAVLEKANSVNVQALTSWDPEVLVCYNEGEIIISDNGPGLPFCPQGCRSDNCLTCPAVSLGKTTKQDGHGIGLFRIGAAAAKLGIEVVMRTTIGEGVTTWISFPPRLISEQ